MNDVAELVSMVFSGLSALVIEDAEDAGEVICVRARTRDVAVACPGCGTQTARVHGYYERTAADVPAGGRRVLVRVRYPPGTDGLPGGEGAFLPCSFWLIQALATTGQAQEAAELFEQLLVLASPVGLYGEEMDPATHAHLGNYPQALTHAALVQAALALRDTQPPAGGRQRPAPRRPKAAEHAAARTRGRH
jgi:hypothetical protein